MLQVLRKRRWVGATGTRPTSDGERASLGGGELLFVCARCGHEISDTGAKIEMNGLYEHSQINPHGYIWRFGCFSRAPGVVPAGPRETNFSWFSGMTWRLARCGRCALHLGWTFEGPGELFCGLILERLAERERGN